MGYAEMGCRFREALTDARYTHYRNWCSWADIYDFGGLYIGGGEL